MPPRLYALFRRQDRTGVSGTGLVAWVVEWPDGMVSCRWATGFPPPGRMVPVHQTEVWDGVDELMSVHGHHGCSQLTLAWPGGRCPLLFAVGAGVPVAWGVRWLDRRVTVAAVHHGGLEITDWATVDAAERHRWRGVPVVWLEAVG